MTEQASTDAALIERLGNTLLIVAPDERPWSFFWCTFLLFGPLGVAPALIAPSRPTKASEN